MQRQMNRPACLGAPSLSNSQANVSVQSSGQGVPPTSSALSNSLPPAELGASYVVSASGAHLRLGQHYQVSSTGAHELNPLTGSTTALGKSLNNYENYELGLAASGKSALKCRHISELDIDNESLIGQGSSAKVYQVVHKPTGIRVCVKQMHIDDSRHREEVKRELDSLHKAESRFIVDFYGAFFHNELGVILLVLELMDGSLADILKERGGSITEYETKAFAYQIVLGLHFLHEERHLMHRDIKPANLLVRRTGAVKIADFGISRCQVSSGPEVVHTFVGSISYMSPERLSGGTYGYESDVWSVGVVLCEAVTGLHPYHDDVAGQAPTFWDLLQRVMQRNDTLHRSPLKYKPGREGISDEMDNFVSRCLAFERSDRATATELLQHPWLADMTMERSEQVIRDTFQAIMHTKIQLLPQQVVLESPSVNARYADLEPGDEPQQLGSSSQLISHGSSSVPLASTALLSPGGPLELQATSSAQKRSAAMLNSLMGSL